MVGLPLWAVFAVAFGSPMLAFLGVVTAQWFARKSDRELEDRSRREETMRTLRWAAEPAASRDEPTRELGVSQLGALADYSLLGERERSFVLAALGVVAAGADTSADRGRRTYDDRASNDRGGGS